MGLLDFGFNFSRSNASVGLNKWDTDWLYQKQNQYWRDNTAWFNQNGYSLMREGLESAGYNPLLALGREPVSGATVSGSVMDERSNASDFSMSGIPLGTRAFQAQLRNTNADTALKNAQTEENISRSNLEITQEILENKRIPFQDKMIASEALGLELKNMYSQALIKPVSALTDLIKA